MAKNLDWAALARDLRSQYASAPGLRTDPAKYQVRRDVASKTKNPVAQAARSTAQSANRQAGDVSRAVHAAQQATGQGTGRGASAVVQNPPVSTLGQAAQQIAQAAPAQAHVMAGNRQDMYDAVDTSRQSLADISNSPWSKQSYDNAMPGYGNTQPGYDNLGNGAPAANPNFMGSFLDYLSSGAARQGIPFAEWVRMQKRF
jgi:hypothetical protein